MKQHDLIIIGAGPGGYIAAIRAAQLGLDVACIDDNPALGGTCLRVGCIPSKALLESSEHYEAARLELAEHGVVVEPKLDLGRLLQRKDKVVKTLTQGVRALFKKNKITRYHGRARIVGPGRIEILTPEKPGAEVPAPETLGAEHILIATGSAPASIPGIEIDGTSVVSSTGALDFQEVPEHLVVVGAGFIGLELGSVWRRLGARVTVLEALDRILPGLDLELARASQRLLQRQGLELRLETRVEGIDIGKEGCMVRVAGDEAIPCDRVLMAVGRRPVTDGLELESVGVQTDERGFIQVDRDYRTTAPGFFAIGDVIGGAQLAHKAEEEGVAFAEKLVSGYGHVSYGAIPSVVYTHPEIASVGHSEEELEEADVPFRKGSFPLRANARARTLGQVDGFAKVLAHRDTDRILGVHLLGPHAGELIAEAVAAIEFGASSEDLARVCHPHPTLSEALKEACLACHGRSLNS